MPIDLTSSALTLRLVDDLSDRSDGVYHHQWRSYRDNLRLQMSRLMYL